MARKADPEQWIVHASTSYDQAVLANEVNWRKLCAVVKAELERFTALGELECCVNVECFGEFMIHRMRNLLVQRLYRVEFSYADGPVHSIHALRIKYNLGGMYARAREIMSAIARAKADQRTSCTLTLSNTILKELEWVASGLRSQNHAVSIRPHVPVSALQDGFSDSGDEDDARDHIVSVSWTK